LNQNWRTKWCEIDIVAQKTQTIYFVEVKYRKSAAWGSGLEYITSKKLKQMQFAAMFWVTENNWDGDYSLAAVEVTGPAFKITNFLPEV
jgi:Holliday junction resolvase-like predicted endonuclease